MVVAEAASAIVARGRARTSAGSPSPSWASMLAVPSTSRASLAQAKASSLVPRAPPMMPMPAGPSVSSALRNSAAASSSAADHDVSSSWAPSRTAGLARRSWLFGASKLNRPRSHIQPQLTASESWP